MEYQKIIYLINNQVTPPSKFRTKNWVEINDNARGTYNTNSRIKFKTIVLSLFDYSDAYMLAKGTKQLFYKEQVQLQQTKTINK